MADSGHPLLQLWDMDGKSKQKFPPEYHVHRCDGHEGTECFVMDESGTQGAPQNTCGIAEQ
eukprot:6103037-Amphidinium_carterae.1